MMTMATKLTNLSLKQGEVALQFKCLWGYTTLVYA